MTARDDGIHALLDGRQDALPRATWNPEQRRKPRLSFPMAVYVWEDEILEVLPGIANPKYEPIKAINFHTSITSKFYGENYAVKA